MASQPASAAELPAWLFDRRRRMRWCWIPLLAGLVAVFELLIFIPNLVWFLGGDRTIFGRWWRCFRAGTEAMLGTYEEMLAFQERVFVQGEFSR